MIQQITFNNIGNTSVNSDLAAIELPLEFITSGDNFLIDGNALINSPRHDVWTIPPVDFNGGHLHPLSVSAGKFWMVLGRSAVYVYDGSTWSDLTSAAGYIGLGVDDELLWSSTMLGSIPIINNPQHVPEYWSPQSITQVMQPLDFSPGTDWATAVKSFKIIRSHKTFLFALNLVEGGVEMPNSYRWSHPADLNGLPFTWDETDNSAIASIEQISGDSGQIIDGRSLRDSFCIYSERGINILDFVGGEFVFQNRELSNTYGLITDKCIVEVAGVHYFISGNDILRNDGNSITSIAYNRIRKRFRSKINRAAFDRSYVVLNQKRKEVLFCVAEDNALYPNIAYVYNYINDTWTFQSLPDLMSHAAFGSITESSAPVLTYNILTETHNTTSLLYSSSSVTPPFSTDLIGLDSTNSGLLYLNPITNGLALDTNSIIERTDIPLGGNNKVTTLVKAYPHMTSSSPIIIQFGSQEFTGGAVTWKPEMIFNPSTDRKLDIRTTGSLHAYRVKSSGQGSLNFSGMTLEFAPAGGR